MVTEWTVEGLVEAGSNALQALDDLAEDVLRAINNPPDVLGGKVEGIFYAGRVLTGPRPGSNLAQVAVNFTTVAMRRID